MTLGTGNGLRGGRRSRTRGVLTGWILAWVVAVFLPGLVFTIMSGAALSDFLGEVWGAADRISPWPKLAIGGLLGLLFLAVDRGALQERVILSISVVAGVLTMSLVLLLLPQTLSEGFGVGSSGEQSSVTKTFVYLLSGALAGIIFAIVRRRS